jgi:hypothetical protein
MELVTDNVHLLQLVVSNFDAFWIFVGVQFTPHGQSSTGGRGSNEMHNVYIVFHQRRMLATAKAAVS